MDGGPQAFESRRPYPLHLGRPARSFLLRLTTAQPSWQESETTRPEGRDRPHLPAAAHFARRQESRAFGRLLNHTTEVGTAVPGFAGHPRPEQPGPAVRRRRYGGLRAHSPELSPPSQPEFQGRFPAKWPRECATSASYPKKSKTLLTAALKSRLHSPRLLLVGPRSRPSGRTYL